MKCILVATDGSDGANRALDYAAELARDTGADLVVVNVIGSLPGEVFRRFTRAQHAWLDQMLESLSADILQAARRRVQEAGAATVHVESRIGDAAESIIEVAGEREADAIVVGKRGAGRVAGMLLGSVSQKLASVADRVVIVVP